MAKDTFYFSHDYNTRNDEKVKQLVRKHGMEGYGVWWAIVEDLYNNANALRTDYDGIAYDLRVQIDLVKSVLHDFDLFCFDGDNFGSSSIDRRLSERNSKSEKARQSAVSRWNKKTKNANALRTQSDGNAIKERKGNKIKENETTTNTLQPILIDGYLEPDFLKDAYLNDDDFRMCFYNTGLKLDTMPDWMDAFKRRLIFEEKFMLPKVEYKKFFFNWLGKLPPEAKRDAKAYVPSKNYGIKHNAPSATPLQKPLRSA